MEEMKMRVESIKSSKYKWDFRGNADASGQHVRYKYDEYLYCFFSYNVAFTDINYNDWITYRRYSDYAQNLEWG